MYEAAYMPALVGAVLCGARRLGYISFSDARVPPYLLCSLAYVVGTYVCRARAVIHQITAYLDIYCLSIKHKLKGRSA